jgi:dihydropteroate synthase
MVSKVQPSLTLGGRQIDLSTPIIMGVVNVTPDSFSDGSNLGSLSNGKFKLAADKILLHADAMVSAGARILDIGGESTRPGADPVSVQEELDRVIPSIESIRNISEVSLSVDTSTPAVMIEACKAGADMINDVRALRRDGALEAAATTTAAVCLMHTLDEPKIMQQSIQYDDVVVDILKFLKVRVEETTRAGIVKDRLIVDPGFGFGKTVQQNFRLLGELEKFKELGLPILIGISRKSMIGTVVERPVDQRGAGSLAAAAFALSKGASIIRTHDVAATLDVVKIHCAMENGRLNE